MEFGGFRGSGRAWPPMGSGPTVASGAPSWSRGPLISWCRFHLSMMIMAREGTYEDLAERLSGRRVIVWTCNTCARLCNGIGGREAAGRLAEGLSEKGVDVVGVMSTSVSCMMSKVLPLADGAPEADVVLALTCDMGARCAGEAFGCEVLNPLITFGPGYLDAEGRPRLCTVVCGRTVVDEDASEAAGRVGAEAMPYL